MLSIDENGAQHAVQVGDNSTHSCPGELWDGTNFPGWKIVGVQNDTRKKLVFINGVAMQASFGGGHGHLGAPPRTTSAPMQCQNYNKLIII
jgi:hypothetical protein